MSRTRAYAIVGLRVDPEKLKRFLLTHDFNHHDQTLFDYSLIRRSDDQDFEFLGGTVLADGEDSSSNFIAHLPADCLAHIIRTLRDEMRSRLQQYGLWEEGKFGVHVILYVEKEGA